VQEAKKAPKIAAVGGGTGLSVLLRSLKSFTPNITAIVAMTDDGGSSGQLRKSGYLPPGDIRNCLVALADTAPSMEQFLNYRFDETSSLAGHNVGNLLMVGLTQITNGNFAEAVAQLSRVLAVKGQVLPVTADNVRLFAEMEDNSVIIGETNMVADSRHIHRVFLEPANCTPLPAVIESIKTADCIIIGPGSLYTSIITNLLVPGVVQAMRESQAPVYYICNIVTQPGEMELDHASQYVQAIHQHTGPGLINKVIVNNAPFPVAQRATLSGCVKPVQYDPTLNELGLEIIAEDLYCRESSYCHDQQKLAQLFLKQKHLWVNDKEQ